MVTHLGLLEWPWPPLGREVMKVERRLSVGSVYVDRTHLATPPWIPAPQRGAGRRRNEWKRGGGGGAGRRWGRCGMTFFRR